MDGKGRGEYEQPRPETTVETNECHTPPDGYNG